MFYVYILQNKDKRLYVGSTNNLQRRFREHNAGQNIATKPYLPWIIIFYEAYIVQEDALRREQYLKTTQGRLTLRRMLRVYFSK
jgi:putative endonuclease